MKITTLMPPVVALAIAGTWLGTQRRSISTLAQESASLQKAIAAQSSSSSGSDPAHSKPGSVEKVANDKERIDWKRITEQFSEMSYSVGMGDMRAMMRFQQHIQSMTRQDLIAALDEISTLDLPGKSRDMLEMMLLGPLVEKDQEYALSRFIDRIQGDKGSISWQLSNAMLTWAKKDPVAASAWFDRQIAAGKFDSKSLDGKSRNRIQFESSMIHALLGSDPDAARQRLARLPEDERDEALSQFSYQQLKQEDQLAFAKLIRDQLPEKEQARILAQQASHLVGGNDYSKVSEYLDRIQATPAERTAAVEKAAEFGIRITSYNKGISHENLDNMRAWVASQAPESTGRVTGRALASALQGGGKMEFSEAANLAIEYNTAAGNDEVLSEFLDSWGARQNKEQARMLAEKLVDEKRREYILNKLK